MRTHITSRTWMPEQLEELRALVTAGASPARAAARLKRSIASVQIKAKDEGFPFVDRRIVKRQQRKLEAESRRGLG